jgi:hypothetical protein
MSFSKSTSRAEHARNVASQAPSPYHALLVTDFVKLEVQMRTHLPSVKESSGSLRTICGKPFVKTPDAR